MTDQPEGTEMPKPQLLQSAAPDYIANLTAGANATLAAMQKTGNDIVGAAVEAALAVPDKSLPPFSVHSDALRGRHQAEADGLRALLDDLGDKIAARKIELDAEIARAQAHADHDVLQLEAERADIRRAIGGLLAGIGAMK